MNMLKNIARRYADGNLIVQILVGIILGALVGFYTHYETAPYNNISAKIQTIQNESGLSVDEVIKTRLSQDEAKQLNEAKEKAKFYDYIEIMPKAIYRPLIKKELIRNEHHLEEIIQNLLRLLKIQK